MRLLAVKKLLADQWSVFKIKEFMRTLDITALEELVNVALVSSVDSKTSVEGGRSLRATEPLSAEDEQEAGPPAPFQTSAPPHLASLALESARRHERAVTEWVEIAPGLEIKVRRSFRPPASEEDRARLATRFWSVILKEES